jgi:hypothetical protein
MDSLIHGYKISNNLKEIKFEYKKSYTSLQLKTTVIISNGYLDTK